MVIVMVVVIASDIQQMIDFLSVIVTVIVIAIETVSLECTHAPLSRELSLLTLTVEPFVSGPTIW